MSQELTRFAVLGAALVIAVVIGLVVRRTSGTAARDAGEQVLTADDLGSALGSRATVVQFSTVVCAPCRSTRRVLDEVTGRMPGVAHIEVNAEERVDLLSRLRVRRTPTVLVLDSRGRIVRRISGALTGQQARAAIAAAAPEAVAA